MAGVIEKESLFVDRFPEFCRSHASEPAWLRNRREASAQRFAELGFPTTRQEDWKYTNLAPLSRIGFELPQSGGLNGKGFLRLSDLESELWVEGCSHLVFVNGYFSEELSSFKGLPQGITVSRLASRLSEGTVEANLSDIADPLLHPFVALNTAFWQDGAYIHVGRGTVFEKPIHIVHVSSALGAPLVSHPRTLIVAEPETQLTVMESYFGWGGGIAFSNAVTEIAVDESAVVDHYKLQIENENSYHISTVKVRQERQANFSSCSVSFGSRLARTEIGVLLDAEGADCALNGLYLAKGDQHVDNYTTIDHAKPHGTSNQFYKGILDGRAAGVFNGRIIVRKDAQKTDAVQKNKNLLLSEEATVDTKPQLEIFANDVRCTHGATVGQIDPEALFYLESRGIGGNEARNLLTYAFAGDILDRIRLAPVRACLERCLQARLAGSTCAAERPRK